MTPISVMSQEGVAEVTAAMHLFEGEFEDMVSGAERYIESQDANFLSEFRSYLLMLPVSTWYDDIKLFSRDEISDVKKTPDVFAVVRQYCNFFHHNLFHLICMRFCEDPLKKRMLEYAESFERFEDDTPLDIFLQAFPSFPTLKFFEKCSVVMDYNNRLPPDCRLSKLREFKYVLAYGCSIRLYGIFIDSIDRDRSVVMFRIHPNVELPLEIIISYGCM